MAGSGTAISRAALAAGAAALAAVALHLAARRRVRQRRDDEARRLSQRRRLVVPLAKHREIIHAAFRARGYDDEEATAAADLCEKASWHGVSSHNGLKARAMMPRDAGASSGSHPSLNHRTPRRDRAHPASIFHRGARRR